MTTGTTTGTTTARGRGIITMPEDFLIRAGLAGAGLALATGPLGAMVVWRRMAYFGDATAHAAILGVALALALGLPTGLGTLAVALAMAVTVATLAARGWAMDTTLGVLAHSALAFGLVAVSLIAGVRTDLSALLFGDILAVSAADLAFVWTGAGAVVALLLWRWRPLLTATVSEDLAHAAGVNPDRERLVLTLALAIVVAVAIKIVGALLIAAMLIIPAAAARGLARSPEGMAALAAGIGVAAVAGGLALSLAADTPAGPSIVTVAAAAFALAAVAGQVRRGG
jgi:zinc transport system permease protein